MRPALSFCLFFLTLAVSATGSLTFADETPGEVLLREARGALAGRDLPTAKAKLDEAAKLEGERAFQDEVERLQMLLHYNSEFWKAVNQGASTLQPTEEFVVNEQPTAVVEYDGQTLILRVAGRNVRYTHKTVPPRVALAIAELVLKDGDANNRVFFGSFLAMDAKGNRELAAKYWMEAKQAGVDVAQLLPELSVAPAIPIEIPAMTPLMRRALLPAAWTLLERDGDKVLRKPADKISKPNEDGRLVIASPADASLPTRVAFSRRLAADFGCRVLVQNSTAGQRFGFFSPTDAGQQFTVTLPAGTVKVELARRAGKFQCLVNGAPQELTAPADANTRMPGMLGVEIDAGQTCTIYWLELSGR